MLERELLFACYHFLEEIEQSMKLNLGQVVLNFCFNKNIKEF